MAALGGVVTQGPNSTTPTLYEDGQQKERTMTDKSATHSYCLIVGVFLPDEARQVLLTLIHDKISFHHRNDWSRRERLGDTNPPGTRRVDQLIATREELKAMLADAEQRGMQLVINCDIDIRLEPAVDSNR